MLAVFSGADAQGLQLIIISSNAQETKTIDTVGYSKSFENYETLLLEIERFKEVAYRLGYIESTVQSVTKNTSETVAQLMLGPKYESVQIYGDKVLFELLDLKPIETTGSLSYHQTKVSELEVLMNQLTDGLASKSFPFASVTLKNIIPIDKTTLKADLVVVTKQARQLNTVEIKGYDKFPRSFIKHYLGIKTNIPFDLKAIQTKTETLDQLSFTNQLRPAEVLFTQDTTSVYLYLEKNKSNRFDGFLGFGSEETTGNLELNGYLYLNLVNNLNYGESFVLNYRSDENDLKTFESKLTLPYLFKSPIGSELKLNIFKKDSTFTTAEQSVNLFYQLNPKQRLFVGIKTAQSNALEPIESSTIIDYKTNAYELRYTYQNRTPKDLLFPVKSQMEVRLSRASRKTSALKTNQNIYLIKAAHLFNLNKSNSLYINLNAQGIDSKNYVSNELLRFGGIRTIRGFEENSINASSFGVLASEYRLRLSPSLYVHSIIDAAYFNTPIKSDQKLVGIGFGFGLLTEAGLLKFNLANGQLENQNFRFSDSKVHLSLTATF
tara:strand:+ start:3453 stop:5102 length:1650 start_codon:yes stop_codon:yes gene_type:complete